MHFKCTGTRKALMQTGTMPRGRPSALRNVGVRVQRGWHAALAVGTFLVAATPAFAGGILDWLFHHDVRVITSTDATPAGALLRPASLSDPVYYAALSIGYRDLGVSMAGGDKPPAPQDMIRNIVRILAKQGYLPADTQHRATQLIMFVWGTLRPDVEAGTQLNRSQMLRFLGGDKLDMVTEHPDDRIESLRMESLLPGLTRLDPDAEAIADVAGDDLYVVALVSYEFPLKQPEHPKLLWRTKISCPASGLVLADTLPTMVALAARYIGRATGRPVWVDASDEFKPDVRIGNPKVEEYLDSEGPPPKSGPTGN